MHVFISYTRVDADRVRDINKFIAQRGYETWFDEERLKGNPPDFNDRILKAITGCGLFIMCVSRNYFIGDGYVHIEHLLATKDTRFGVQGSIPTLCLRLEACPLPSLAVRHPVIDWSRRDGPKILADVLAFAPHIHRRPIACVRDWLERRRSYDPTHNLTLLDRVDDSGNPSIVQFKDIPVDLLGTRHTKWTRRYETTPTRAQVRDDVEREYPWAFINDDVERESALILMAEAALNSADSRWQAEDGVLTEQFGVQCVAEMFRRIGHTALEALRSGESQHVVIHAMNHEAVTALVWRVHPKSMEDTSRLGKDLATLRPIFDEIVKFNQARSERLDSLAIVDIFYSLTESNSYQVEGTICIPLLCGKVLEVEVAPLRKQTSVHQTPRSPWWRFLSASDRKQLLLHLNASTEPDGTLDRARSCNIIGTEFMKNHVEGMQVLIEEVIQLHVKKLQSTTNPVLQQFLDENLSDEIVDHLSRAAAGLLEEMVAGGDNKPLIVAVIDDVKLPVHKRTAWLVHAIPASEQKASDWFRTQQGYLAFVSRAITEFKKKQSISDWGIFGVLSCGLNEGEEPWVATSILPIRSGCGLKGAIIADFLTEAEKHKLKY